RDRDRFDADGSGNALAAAARGIAERGGEAHEREGVLGRGPARGGSGDLRLRAAAEGSDEAGVLLRRGGPGPAVALAGSGLHGEGLPVHLDRHGRALAEGIAGGEAHLVLDILLRAEADEEQDLAPVDLNDLAAAARDARGGGRGDVALPRVGGGED